MPTQSGRHATVWVSSRHLGQRHDHTAVLHPTGWLVDGRRSHLPDCVV